MVLVRCALPLFLVLAPRLALASGAACTSGNCQASAGRAAAVQQAEQDRALHLLQQRGRSTTAAGADVGSRRKSPLKSVNLALEGGGAASTTIFSAFLAGSMHVLATLEGQDPSTATFESTGLFRSIDNITSVSGGSWTMAGLFYSPFYLKTVELIAQKPEDDELIWNERWTQPLLGQPDGVTLEQMVRIIETCILGTVLPPEVAKLFLPILYQTVGEFIGGASRTLLEDLILFSYYFASEANRDPNKAPVQYTWQTYVDEFLIRTTKLTPYQVLGQTPNSFAIGKEWIPVVTQLNPARGDFSTHLYVRDLLFELNKKFVTYQMEQSKADAPSCPWMSQALCDAVEMSCAGLAQILFGPHYITPARFSISLGDGKAAKAPLPWCDDESCAKRRVQYHYQAQLGPLTTANITAPAPLTQGEFSAYAFDMNAGKLPINSVTAASSAAAGILAMTSSGLPPACGLSGSAVEASAVGKGKSFAYAQQFMENERNNIQSGGTFTEADFKKATKMVLQLIADGGLADNTGAMTAVGEGATEVFMLMAINSSYFDMFTPDSGFDSFASYHVFQETQSQAVQNLASGASLALPREFVHLFGIRYGFFEVTTADSADARAFGIPPNKKVLLEWVFFDTNVGLFEPIFSGSQDPLTALTEEYNTVVQEVVETMVYKKNLRHVKTILKELGALK